MWVAISAAIAGIFAKYKSQFLIAGVAIVALLGVILYAYFDIEHKKAVAAEMAVQQVRIEQLKAQQEMLARDQANILKHSEAMIRNLTQIREDIAKRQNQIVKHDLGRIGAKHPRVLENRINKATRDQIRRFEEITKP